MLNTDALLSVILDDELSEKALGEELFMISPFDSKVLRHFNVFEIFLYTQVLSNKCYICDLSAMDDGNVELDLGLV